jgi:hypothetical protein
MESYLSSIASFVPQVAAQREKSPRGSQASHSFSVVIIFPIRQMLAYPFPAILEPIGRRVNAGGLLGEVQAAEEGVEKEED